MHTTADDAGAVIYRALINHRIRIPADAKCGQSGGEQA